MFLDWYILDENKRAIPATAQEASAFLENFENKKVKQEVIGNNKLSTVFLGLDHRFGDGPPLLFETMQFPCDNEGVVTDWGEIFCDRYSTWEEALAGHEERAAYLRQLEETKGLVKSESHGTLI